jgi:preprotein translocase subunit SecE
MSVSMAEKAQGPIGRAGGWFTATKDYIQELQLEMRRVTWPSWKQVRATTGVVIACVFAFAAYFYVVDLAISNAVNRVLKVFAK